MLATRPRTTNALTNSLPTGRKIRNFQNRRINLHDLFQSNELGISRRSV